MLGQAGPDAGVPLPAARGRLLAQALLPLRDAQSWLDILWCLVGLVTGTVAFVVAVTWWAAARRRADLLVLAAVHPRRPDDDTTLAELIGLGEGRHAETCSTSSIGAVRAAHPAAAWSRFAAALHGGLAHVLLCSRAELQQEVRRVEGGRDAARAAEADSLRRLERDIHDGPQQRLVRLAMDLGRAASSWPTTPTRAGDTIDAALPRPARPSTSCARSRAASRRRCWSTAASRPRSAS